MRKGFHEDDGLKMNGLSDYYGNMKTYCENMFQTKVRYENKVKEKK